MIKLSEHFSYLKLRRFTFPSIFMLIFTSAYGIVDGFFVSNFVGKIEFTALNFIMPFLMLLGCFGFLFGTGGGALIAKTIGEGDRIKSNQIFSMLVYLSIFCGIIFGIGGYFWLPIVSSNLGATGDLLDLSVRYGRILMFAIPVQILQFEFQCLLPAAEKPKLGFYITVAAGVTNMIFDAVLILGFDLGLEGAAIATALSQLIGGILPLIYFARENSSLLRLTSTHFDSQALLQTCANGSSELMTSIATSLVSMLYNVQLLKFAGENGVAAYGILMYTNLVFQSIFIGYSVGISPVVSYHFGAQNSFELKNLLIKSLRMIAFFAVAMFVSAEILAYPLAMLFVSYDKDLLELTIHAFRIFSFAFLLAGFTVFTSAFFTALNNGKISAAVSFLRTLIFETSSVLILPTFFGINGIWMSVVVAEIMAVTVSSIFIFKNRARYQYF